VYLTDMRDFQDMNKAYGEYFGEPPPVRASGGVRLTSDAYNVEMSFVASAAPRRRIDADVAAHPNVSSAIASSNGLFVRALLPAPETYGQPAAEARDVLQQLDRVLTAAGFRRDEVREVLLYVASERAGEDAAGLCRDVIGSSAAMTVVHADIGRPGASVELAVTAIRAQ
jgi:enamine deaminase RidA (YjgF/YER057c/UK114 family)